MESSAQAKFDSQLAAQSASQYGTRAVPADWFLDPADPEAQERFRSGTSLEEQATAFLEAHTALDADTELLAPDTGADLLTFPEPVAPAAPKRTSRAKETDKPNNVWLGMPLVDTGFDDEGELSWQADALCAQTDPEAFFPEKGGSTRDAKKVCGECTVKSECLEYALAHDERFGIWGGLSERERRKLRKRAV